MFFYARRSRFLLLLCLLAWVDDVRGAILSYNASSGDLYLRCPGERLTEGEILFIGLRRQHDDLPLANWTESDKGMVTYDRVSLLPARRPHLLAVALHYVTCYDVTTYKCNMIVHGADGRTTILNQSQPFTFGGDVTDPVLRVEPHRARYMVGELLRMTCSAHTGSPTNSIVWESRLPGDNFSLVTGDCDKGTNITEQKSSRIRPRSCDVSMVSSLSHILTPHDDSREWRCRLKETNQNAVFAVAVQCLNGTGAPVGTSPMQIVLIAVIGVLFLAVVLSIVLMISFVKKQMKKHQLFSLPPSEAPYGYTSGTRFRTRSLPQLPSVIDLSGITHDDLNFHRHSPHPHHRHHCAGTGTGGGVGGRQDIREMETRPKPFFSPTSSSVYVSMSALPSLHEDPKADHTHHHNQQKLQQLAPPCPGGVGGPPPHPEFRRSESIYSNGREACDTETTKISCGSSVESRDDSHVTMGNLKGWM